jgi:hypothetical protein
LPESLDFKGILAFEVSAVAQQNDSALPIQALMEPDGSGIIVCF